MTFYLVLHHNKWIIVQDFSCKVLINSLIVICNNLLFLLNEWSMIFSGRPSVMFRIVLSLFKFVLTNSHSQICVEVFFEFYPYSVYMPLPSFILYSLQVVLWKAECREFALWFKLCWRLYYSFVKYVGISMENKMNGVTGLLFIFSSVYL